MSLIHWLPLTNGEIKDFCGATIDTSFTKANPSTTVDNGKLGTAFAFADNGIRIKNVQVSKAMSFACWIKLAASSTSCHIIDLRGHDNSTETGYQPIYYNASSGVQIFSSAGGGAYAPCTLDTNWHHLVVTMQEGEGVLYLDGVRKHTITTVKMLTDVAHLTIGCRCSGANPLSGYLQDVRVYDHILSRAEVKELSKALVVHYTFDDILAEPTTNIISGIQSAHGNASLESGRVKINWSPSGADSYFFFNCTQTINANSVYTLSFDCKGLKSGEVVTFAVNNLSGTSYNVALKNGRNSLTFTAGSDLMNAIASASNRLFFDDKTRTDGAVFYLSNFQLEARDHATPYTLTSRESRLVNEAGYVNPSSVVDLQLSTISNNGSYSGHFNGTTSYIDTPMIKSNMFTSDYTLSFWVYPLDDGRAVYFGDYNTTNSSQINFERYAGGNFRYYHNNNPNWSVAEAKAPVGVWTLLTVTYTPGTLSVYKNGTLANTLAHTATLTKTAGSVMRIGRDSRSATDATNSNSTPLNGYIDDFRFYATCLDKDEVARLYNSSGYLGSGNSISFGEFTELQDGILIKKGGVFNASAFQEMNGYEALDYIQSTGNQYIDTGYYWTSEKATIKADLEIISNSASQSLFGNEEYTASSGTARSFAHILYGSGGSFDNYIGSTKHGAKTKMTVGEGNRYLLEYIAHGNNTFTTKTTDKNGVVTIFNNGTTYGGTIQTKGAAWVNTGVSKNIGHIFIFSNHNSNRGTLDDPTQNVGKMRLYRFTMYDNDICVRDFYPCKRISDGAIGLLDLINGGFYKSPNGNAFEAGAEKTLNTHFTSEKFVRTNEIIEI